MPLKPLALNLETTVGRFEERLGVRHTSQAHPSIALDSEGERGGILEASKGQRDGRAVCHTSTEEHYTLYGLFEYRGSKES